MHQEVIIALNEKGSELKSTLLHDEYIGKMDIHRNLISRYSPLIHLTVEMLHQFVERIDVDNNGHPTVTYRFSILSD